MINVTKNVYHTPWQIYKQLAVLNDTDLLSFDIETKGLYSKEERKEALKLLDEDLELYHRKLVSVVANNSGLSFPSLTRTTHFIFGTSKSHSVILVPPGLHIEILIWNWISKYRGMLLIHNTLFDLKVMYHRVRVFPKHYQDTALMAKTLMNNSDVWKSKVSLKELMGGYYSPAWSLFDGYEPENPMDPDFISYSAIDGAATYYLYELILKKSGNGE
jgi:hypothetical protein